MGKGQDKIIHTVIGEGELDRAGSPLGVSRLDVDQSYTEIPNLLQKVIRQDDEEAWEEIKKRINYSVFRVSIRKRHYSYFFAWFF